MAALRPAGWCRGTLRVHTPNFALQLSARPRVSNLAMDSGLSVASDVPASMQLLDYYRCTAS